MFLMEAPNWSLFVFDHHQPSILRVDPGIVSNGLDVIASILVRWVHFCHLMFPVVYTYIYIWDDTKDLMCLLSSCVFLAIQELPTA